MLKLGQKELTALCKTSYGLGVTKKFLVSGAFLVSRDWIIDGHSEEFAALCRTVNSKHGDPKRDFFTMKDETILSIIPDGQESDYPLIERSQFTYHTNTDTVKSRLFHDKTGQNIVAVNEVFINTLEVERARLAKDKLIFTGSHFSDFRVLVMRLRTEGNPFDKDYIVGSLMESIKIASPPVSAPVTKGSVIIATVEHHELNGEPVAPEPVAPGIETAKGYHKPKRSRKVKAIPEPVAETAPEPELETVAEAEPENVYELPPMALAIASDVIAHAPDTDDTDDDDGIIAPPPPPVNPNGYVVVALFKGEPVGRMVAQGLTEKKAFRIAKDYGFRADVVHTEWFALQ